MAITERREIIFDADEVYAALQGLSSTVVCRLGLPLERPIAVQFRSAETRLAIQYAATGADASASLVGLDGPHLAVFMMQWCRLKQVPLPRQASKSVQVVDDALVLSLSLTSKQSD
jgi:hypothetical protein